MELQGKIHLWFLYCSQDVLEHVDLSVLVSRSEAVFVGLDAHRPLFLKLHFRDGVFVECLTPNYFLKIK